MESKKFSGDWTQYVDVCWNDIDDDFRTWDREWDDFWEEVEAYATHYGVSTRYVEEEFIIDGEFIAVQLEFDNES